jgi:hypothetical protein
MRSFISSFTGARRRARVYILAGQSNSNGEGVVNDDLPLNLSGEFNNVFIINRNTTGVENLQYFVNNKDELVSGPPELEAIGQELELGRLLHNHYKTDIYFIKVATGGVGVHTGQVWSYIDGSYHTALEGYYDTLLEYFTNNNIAFDAKGLIWVQGEDSSNVEETAIAYFDDALATFNRIRTYVDEPNMPIIQVRLTEIANPFWETTRAKQELLSSTYSSIYYVNADDVEKEVDNLHYSMEGQIELSNRIFNILKYL